MIPRVAVYRKKHCHTRSLGRSERRSEIGCHVGLRWPVPSSSPHLAFSRTRELSLVRLCSPRPTIAPPYLLVVKPLSKGLSVAMSFGFSVGDFLAAIELVHNLALALSNNRGSGAKFKGLIQELYAIERVMIEIKTLQMPPGLESQIWMVQQATSQAQTAITKFLQQNDVYMRYLGQENSSKWWNKAFYKIKWAVCKSDDVEELRASLRGHTMAMGLVLQVLQMSVKLS